MQEVNTMESLAKDVRDLRDVVIEMKATLQALDLPTRMKDLEAKNENLQKEVTAAHTEIRIMKTQLTPLWAGIAVVVSFIAQRIAEGFHL